MNIIPAVSLIDTRAYVFQQFREEKEKDTTLSPEEIEHDLDTEFAYIAQASLSDLQTVYYRFFN
jgi:hypothetical protein